MSASTSLPSLTGYIRRLQMQRFWGDVTINLKNGDIVLLDIHQSVKPENLQNEDKPNGNGHTAQSTR
jgi:hypothetical protein